MFWSCPKFVKYLYTPKNRCFQFDLSATVFGNQTRCRASKNPCTTIITRPTGNFQAPAEILPTAANLILVPSADALRMEIVALARTERWFSAIRILTTLRLYNPTSGTLTNQALMVGVASIFLRKKLRIFNQQQKNQSVERKNSHPYQFRSAQDFSGCQHPDNLHNQSNWQKMPRNVSHATLYKLPTNTALLKKLCGTNGRMKPIQRDTAKPIANFT